MKLLKDWLLALSVCRKYDIQWSPFRSIKSAECLYCFRSHKKKIMINPFYPKFIDSFMHEVGHLRRWDKIYKRCIKNFSPDPVDSFNLRTDCILKEEYIAWKYSKRFLKERFDKKRAKLFFKSYYRRAVKETSMVVATDRYYAFDRNI